MNTNSSALIRIDAYDLSTNFYQSVVGIEIARRDLRHTFSVTFGYAAEMPAIINQRSKLASELDKDGKVIRELRTWESGLLELQITRTPRTRRYIEVWGYFPDQESAGACLALLGKHLPPEDARPDLGAVSVNFWNASLERSERRARRHPQLTKVPPWREVARNYPVRVRSELDSLMQLQESRIPISRLILWRGLPGTGKTWALRALMSEWLDWCTFHYVVDSEVFFSNSGYMLTLLSAISEAASTDDETDKWSLVILEDAGEFIAMDARVHYGQALSKLLNLSDGLLGQGQKLLFLITTNEELQNLHPAIVRPGRCLANLEFCQFSELEAREWLEAHGCTRSVSSEASTLSHLYAVAESQAPIVNLAPSKRAGFIR